MYSLCGLSPQNVEPGTVLQSTNTLIAKGRADGMATARSFLRFVNTAAIAYCQGPRGPPILYPYVIEVIGTKTGDSE